MRRGSTHKWRLSCHAVHGGRLMHLRVGVIHRSTGRRFGEEAAQIIARDNLFYCASNNIPDLDESWLDGDNVWIMESYEWSIFANSFLGEWTYRTPWVALPSLLSNLRVPGSHACRQRMPILEIIRIQSNKKSISLTVVAKKEFSINPEDSQRTQVVLSLDKL
jgi:hypothetical protein